MKIDANLPGRPPATSRLTEGAVGRSFEHVLDHVRQAKPRPQEAPKSGSREPERSGRGLKATQAGDLATEHAPNDAAALGAEPPEPWGDGRAAPWRAFGFAELGLFGHGKAIESAVSAAPSPVQVDTPFGRGAPAGDGAPASRSADSQALMRHDLAKGEAPAPTLPQQTARPMSRPQHGGQAGLVPDGPPAEPAGVPWKAEPTPPGRTAAARRASLTAQRARPSVAAQVSLVVSADGGPISVVVGAGGLSRRDIAALRRAVAQAALECGVSVGELTINGVPSDAPSRPSPGGSHGHRPD